MKAHRRKSTTKSSENARIRKLLHSALQQICSTCHVTGVGVRAKQHINVSEVAALVTAQKLGRSSGPKCIPLEMGLVFQCTTVPTA